MRVYIEPYREVNESFNVIRLILLINKLYNYKSKVRLPY